VVAERLCHQSNRDPAEGLPDELFSARFREVNGTTGIALTSAPCRDLAGWCGWMLSTPSIAETVAVVRPSTLRSTANDGEAVPIKICKLIKAWFIQDGLASSAATVSR
jgi:hypothetical protein